MRKTILRRLEALEQEHRSHEQKELDSLRVARLYLWKIVLAYYLGGLKSNDEKYLSDANARALKYQSGFHFFEACLKVMRENDTKERSEICERYNDAYRRLFAKVDLDFDATSMNVLFDAFVTMVNQLPDQWLDWLRSEIREWCPHAEIPPGSNIPRGLSGDNFLDF
jgi:hypothetical protein